MPAQQPFRTPVYVPMLVIAAAVIAILFSVMHLQKRVKAHWPW